MQEYSTEEDTDLNDILNYFSHRNLKDKRKDPEDCFTKSN